MKRLRTLSRWSIQKVGREFVEHTEFMPLFYVHAFMETMKKLNINVKFFRSFQRLLVCLPSQVEVGEVLLHSNVYDGRELYKTEKTTGGACFPLFSFESLLYLTTAHHCAPVLTPPVQ